MWVVTRASYSHHLRTMSPEKLVKALIFFEWEDLISHGHTFSQFFLPILTSFSCCHTTLHSFFCVMSPKTEWLPIMLLYIGLNKWPTNYRGSNLIRFMGYRWVMGQNKSILTADRTTFYPRKHLNVTD